jgi:hypothetical protein
VDVEQYVLQLEVAVDHLAAAAAAHRQEPAVEGYYYGMQMLQYVKSTCTLVQLSPACAHVPYAWVHGMLSLAVWLVLFCSRCFMMPEAMT